VNINLVSMDGGWKSTATGLSSLPQRSATTTTCKTMQHSRRFMDQHRSELHLSNWRMGKVIRDAGVKIFQIETTLNNDTFAAPGPFDAAEARVGVDGPDRATFLAMQAGLKRHAGSRARRKIFQSWKAPYGLTSVQAGEVEAVHEVTTEHVYRQHLVPVEGQTDILTMGLPYICPYNVNSIMNPILVMCLGLGYFFNMYRGKPLVREGGVLIMSHPTPWEFHPVHHPSYIDFFEQVLAETTDPVEIEEVREAVRRGRVVPPPVPHELRLPRRPPVLHVVLGQPRPAAPRQGHHRRRRRQGRAPPRLHARPPPCRTTPSRWPPTSSAATPTITHLHNPPILMADVTWWGQPFRGGAAFLSVRTGAPIVPVHLDGTGAIWGKGRRKLEPGRTRVTFGPPLVPAEGEDARELGERLEAAVARLADEATSDWWSAAVRAGRGETPSLAGPDASSWRRSWALTEHRRRLRTGPRRRPDRPWPST
jgi:lactate racemase